MDLWTEPVRVPDSTGQPRVRWSRGSFVLAEILGLDGLEAVEGGAYETSVRARYSVGSRETFWAIGTSYAAVVPPGSVHSINSDTEPESSDGRHVATTLPTGDDWSYEVKWDGYRALLMKDGARVRLISRNLKDLTSDFPTLVVAAQKLKSKTLMIDGEIVAIDEHGRPSFQALQHRGSKQSPVAFYAFDLLHRDGA
jgi:hypothetical protein